LREVLGLLRITHDQRESPDQPRLMKPEGFIKRHGAGADGLRPYHSVAVM
jgi:hypothetical protein